MRKVKISLTLCKYLLTKLFVILIVNYLFVEGPDTISSCGNLTLSGFQSFGGGGRQMNFNWSLVSPTSGDDATDINNILNALSPNDDRIHIPGTILTADTTYEFSLGVANFLGPARFQTVRHSVVKAAEPVPELTLSSSVDLDQTPAVIYVSEDLYIKAQAVVSVLSYIIIIIIIIVPIILLPLVINCK